jgi:flagellar motor switch protein FliN/FliY
MNDERQHEAQGHQFDEVEQSDEPASEHLGLDDLREVPLVVEADLGSCSMKVRDILDLTPGRVIPLDKLAGEMTDIRVNGLPLARGEVVVIGDTLHVRIGEVVGDQPAEEQDEG